MLSSGKASGMDGLTGDRSLKYANHIQPVLLSICLTCMFKHCYLPISMLDSVIVPLVKNRNGEVQLGSRYEGQLNSMAEPIPHEVRPLVRTHVYHPYHAADRQAETDS